MTQFDSEPHGANPPNPASQTAGHGVTAHASEGKPPIEVHPHPPRSKLDVMASGVATGVLVSTITQSGRQLAVRLIKNPVFLFGLGFATGYFAHKHRREIIDAANSAAKRGKKILFTP